MLGTAERYAAKIGENECVWGKSKQEIFILKE